VQLHGKVWKYVESVEFLKINYFIGWRRSASSRAAEMGREFQFLLLLLPGANLTTCFDYFEKRQHYYSPYFLKIRWQRLSAVSGSSRRVDSTSRVRGRVGLFPPPADILGVRGPGARFREIRPRTQSREHRFSSATLVPNSELCSAVLDPDVSFWKKTPTWSCRSKKEIKQVNSHILSLQHLSVVVTNNLHN
jgi:hypothetical protein